MITIQKSLGTIEACQHLKHSLGATSIEHVIENQGGEVFHASWSRFQPVRSVTLPTELLAEERLKTAALCPSVCPPTCYPLGMLLRQPSCLVCVDHAYQHYLAARKGCDYAGGPAPDWDELRNNKPDIAAAWADAANALT